MHSVNKKLLYRKVNTKARGVHHHFGGDFKHSRSSKQPTLVKMRHGVKRGLDYTPLFRFLIASVGKKWNSVFSQAVARLDKPEPIFWLVSLSKDHAQDYVVIGESSYYSGLYVDESGYLQLVNPTINHQSLEPSCACCTHTFNGLVFTKKYKAV